MADNNVVNEATIRSYLAEHGGSVEDPGGRGLTDEMARALGLDRPAALSALLVQMEDDGVITREVRGLRTFRIALTQPEPAAVVENGTQSATAPVERSVSLREALARQKAPGGPPGAPQASDEPVAARWAPTVTARAATGTADPTGRGSLPGRAASRFTTPRGMPPAPPPPPRDPRPSDPGPSDLGSVDLGPGDTAPPDFGRGGSRADAGAPPWSEPAPKSARRQLFLPTPAVNAPPSSITMAAVAAAMVGLVLIAVILVVVARGTGRRVTVSETPPSSSDACNVVTADMATALFGKPAGSPHFVLGTCVYDNGSDELIAEVYRQNARMLFDAGRSASAQTIPGLGDDAYYADGKLRVLKGTSMLEIALGPVPASTVTPKLVALATTAAGHL